MTTGSLLPTGTRQQRKHHTCDPPPLGAHAQPSAAASASPPLRQGSGACRISLGTVGVHPASAETGESRGAPCLTPRLLPAAPSLTSGCSRPASPAERPGGAAPRSAGPGSCSGRAARTGPRRHSAPGPGGSSSRAGSATHSAGGQQVGLWSAKLKMGPRGQGGAPWRWQEAGGWGCAEGRKCDVPAQRLRPQRGHCPSFTGTSALSPPRAEGRRGEPGRSFPWWGGSSKGEPHGGLSGDPRSMPRNQGVSQTAQDLGSRGWQAAGGDSPAGKVQGRQEAGTAPPSSISWAPPDRPTILLPRVQHLCFRPAASPPCRFYWTRAKSALNCPSPWSWPGAQSTVSHISTCTCTGTHTHMHTHAHEHADTNMHMHTHEHAHTNMHMHTRTHAHECICT